MLRTAYLGTQVSTREHIEGDGVFLAILFLANLLMWGCFVIAPYTAALGANLA